MPSAAFSLDPRTRVRRPARSSPANFLVARPCLFLAIAFWGTFGNVAGRAEEPISLDEALNSITAPEIQRHIEVLADDTFEGREGGSRGGRAAAGYLEQQFRKLGLSEGGGKSGYFQPFGDRYQNILGVIRGSDPKLRDEVIVFGAHYDHVGYGTPSNSFGPTGHIHNGADDNASGVAGLLEVAQALLRMNPAPKRTVLFALWDGEEVNLLGSRHWLNHPTFSLDRVAILVNMDMIGRLRKQGVEIVGARTLRGLRRLVCEQNSRGLSLDFTWEIREDSDHYPFFAKRIPVLMFHTGLHEDYHRPSDDAHKINLEGTVEVARLAGAIAHALAERPQAYEFRTASTREASHARKQWERALPPLPPRFGAAWQARRDGQTGVELISIVPGSPAAQAKLHVGDRILRFDGWEASDPNELTRRVLAAEGAGEFEIERKDARRTEKIQVALRGQPVRLGVTWREDDAEPGSILLLRVVPGSLAARAGLLPLDRVFAVSGKEFASGADFLRQTREARSEMTFSVERKGKISRLRVETGELSPSSAGETNDPMSLAP